MSHSRSLVVLVLGVLLATSRLSVGAAPPAKPGPKPPAIVVAPGTEAVVETSLGSFTIRLLPEIAPRHAALFVKTARSGGYDGTTFHRVIAGGIIQGGDPLSKDPAKAALYGTGGLDLLKAELSDRPFVRGSVAVVRKPSSMDSGGKQFFVCLQPQPALTGKYTIFGEVTSGIEVVDQISAAPARNEKAQERIEMKVRVLEPTPAQAEAPAPPSR